MMYLTDETDRDAVYVFASAAGADTDPAWYYNLLAHPDDVEVEIGTETLLATASATASDLPEPERAQVYAVQADRYPGFAEYQAKTSRRIPVIALHLHR